MEVNQSIASEALAEGFANYPEMASFEPRLVCRPVFGGVTYLIEYGTQPPRDNADAWEFQNAVVKAYRRRVEAT